MISPLAGQIGLVPHGHTLIEHGIEYFTHSDVFHVICYLDDDTCLGAQPTGAKIRPNTEFLDAIPSQFPLTPEQVAAAVAWARLREGRPYSWAADGMIAVNEIMGIKTPQFVLERLDSDREYECAQLGDAMLTKGAGIQVFDDGRAPGAVFPGSFEPLFKANGWWPAA